jgi:O-acetylserine/cysteine efflux transporter
MSFRDSLLAALVASIWGFNFVVIDWGMHGVPALLFVAIRFLAVVFPAVFLVPRPALGWPAVLAVGTFMSLGQFGLLYSAMHAGLPPGLAALVLQAQVLFTVLIAAGWLGERPTLQQSTGIVIGATGLVVVGVGRGGSVPLGALLLCVAAALSWGIGNVVARWATSGGGPARSGLSLAVWSALVVPVPLLGLSLLLDGPAAMGDGFAAFGWKAALSTLYTAGLASLLGYSIFNGLLAKYPASSVTPFVLIAPPVAMLSAWALLDEVPNAAELTGAVIVLGGVLATALGVRRTGIVGHVAQRGDDPAGGEVGAQFMDLVEGAEAG